MSEMNEPELLPCPFCGSTVDVVVDYASAYVACNNPKCRVLVCSHIGDDRARKAITAWNSRTPAAPQWTTEPKDNGLYVVRVNGYGIFKLTVVNVMGGCIKDHHGSTHSKEDFYKRDNPRIWLKLDVPPLPEGKEPTK